MLLYNIIIIINDFVSAGNCNLINIKVLILFQPRGVHSECDVLQLNYFWWIRISLALSQLPEEAPTSNIHARKVRVGTDLEEA